MTRLFAQPYDLSASGFYFDSMAGYQAKADTARNDYGHPVEEFEIQFIDGDTIDAELFEALNIYQGNIGGYFEAVDSWNDEDKTKVIIAVGEAGYSFDLASDSPDTFDIDLYECDSLRDLAIQFVDERLYGDIPPSIQNYLDYDAIGRDLGMDYGQTVVDGTRYIYRVA